MSRFGAVPDRVSEKGASALETRSHAHSESSITTDDPRQAGRLIWILGHAPRF
jgi:hypothetical protein